MSVKLVLLLVVGALFLSGSRAQGGDPLADLLGGLLGGDLGGGGGKGGRPGRQQGDRPPPPPPCDKDKLAPSATPYKYRANGCGPEGMQVQEPYGLFKCCNGHDICYSVCGTPFRYCEKVFTDCMSQVCSKFNGETRDKCKQEAKSFSGMTGMFGSSFHKKSQGEVCHCYKSTAEASEAHSSFLMNLYKKFNSTNATPEAVGSTIGQHKGKEHELYFSLIKGYGGKLVRLDNVKDEF